MVIGDVPSDSLVTVLDLSGLRGDVSIGPPRVKLLWYKYWLGLNVLILYPTSLLDYKCIRF